MMQKFRIRELSAKFFSSASVILIPVFPVSASGRGQLRRIPRVTGQMFSRYLYCVGSSNTFAQPSTVQSLASSATRQGTFSTPEIASESP